MSGGAGKGLVIVTGGSRGIGAAISKSVAAAGYSVAVNYTSNAGLADAVVGEITAAGGHAIAIAADVGAEADIKRLFASAIDRFGAPVGLVNNAGVLGKTGRVEDADFDSLTRMLQVNVIGTILCSREAVRIMSIKHGGKGGAIVNLSSAAARLGGPGVLACYAASKGAIDSFTMGLGREVAEEGIRVNAVAPGLIDTDMNSPQRQAEIGPTVPMRRVGKADEIAEAVLWLLTPAASYVAGSILTVSGGR